MKYDRNTVKQWAGNSQFKAWVADLARYRNNGYSGWLSEGFWALTVYRLQRAAYLRRPRWPWMPVRGILAVAKKIVTVVTHISLSPTASIGPGMLVRHAGSVRIGENVTLGADCAMHQVCTVASGAPGAAPVIGDHVMLGCHVCVLGPIQVGNGAKIGAGAVVVTDIPAGATAVGARATAIITTMPVEARPAEVLPGPRNSHPVTALSSIPLPCPQ